MEKDKDIALSTIDNPFSPFSQFKDWYTYDITKGHNCCEYLANANDVDTSLMTEAQEDEIIESVIDDIVRIDPTGLYIKVEKVDPKTNKNGKDFKLCKI